MRGLLVLIVVIPIAVGLVVGLLNKEWINVRVEQLDMWIRRTRKDLDGNEHWMIAYVIRPLFTVLVWVAEVVGSIGHRGWRSGARIWSVLFIVAVWFVLVCYAVAIALVVGTLYLLVRLFAGERATEQRANTSQRRPAAQQGGGWLDSDAPDQFNIPRGGWKSGK